MTTLQATYDDFPYESLPYPLSHPDRLYIAGLLLGLSPTPVQRARVLELGCSTGGNLLAMADVLPNTRFVGIDLSPKQIEIANAFREALGLANIDFHALDLTHLPPEFGTFDYIIAHGLYSWIPLHVRERLMEVCRKHLAPNGLVYLSYNTYPGWHLKEIARGAMLYHVRNITDADERLTKSRQMLTDLATALPDINGAYAKAIHDEVNFLRDKPDYYIAHDHLEQENHPVYFHEFVAHAARHDLQYVCESHLAAFASLDLPAPLANFLRQMKITTETERQQYLDILHHRSFRQSILTHSSNPKRIAPLAEVIENFYLSAKLEFEPSADLNSSAPLLFIGRNGIQFTASDPLIKTMLAILVERFPLPVQFHELLSAAQTRIGQAAPAAQNAPPIGSLCSYFLQAHLRDLCDFSPRPPDFTTEIQEHPTVRPFARLQAHLTDRVTNFLHQVAILSAENQHLLVRLDGKHDRQALREEFINLIQVSAAPGAPPPDTTAVDQMIDVNLKQLAAAALLSS